jgi:hypothetical protein
LDFGSRVLLHGHQLAADSAPRALVIFDSPAGRSAARRDLHSAALRIERQERAGGSDILPSCVLDKVRSPCK